VKTTIVIGGQHACAALQNRAKWFAQENIEVPFWADKVRAVVLRADTPLNIRQQIAGIHNRQQATVKAICFADFAQAIANQHTKWYTNQKAKFSLVAMIAEAWDRSGMSKKRVLESQQASGAGAKLPKRVADKGLGEPTKKVYTCLFSARRVMSRLSVMQCHA
jgi:hypothetical protein